VARWAPKDDRPVEPNEHVGRRLFDEPKLFGATDQAPLDGLSMRNFEPGKDREFSIDRVGDGCFHSKAKKYLEPRALVAATKFRNPARFDGWLTVPARKLMNPQHGMKWLLVASPDRGPLVDGASTDWSEMNFDQNRCHAHVPVPEDMPDQYFAYVARTVFASNNTHHPPDSLETRNRNGGATRQLTRWQRWARNQVWMQKIHRFIWGDEE
jgi:hypothetical protein